MDLTKLRNENRLVLLEEQIMDCSEERSIISDELPRIKGAKQKARHEIRMNDLSLEIRTLWREYRKLTITSAI